MKLDVKFRKIIQESNEGITIKICEVINENGVCPSSEGVLCTDCLKYALEILLEVDDYE